MVASSLLFRLAAVSTLASALPLNINLGAYSPALVVGDGAIGFEGAGQGVEQLMGSLQGAAVKSAAGAAAPAEAAQAPAPAQAAVAPGILNAQASLPVPGTKPIDRREVEEEAEEDETPPAAVQKRQNAGFDRALKYAEAALAKQPKISLGTGEKGSGVGIIVEGGTAGGRAGAE